MLNVNNNIPVQQVQMSNANIAQYQVPPQNFAPQMQMQIPVQINTQQGLGARSGMYGRRQQMYG